MDMYTNAYLHSVCKFSYFLPPHFLSKEEWRNNVPLGMPPCDATFSCINGIIIMSQPLSRKNARRTDFFITTFLRVFR